MGYGTNSYSSIGSYSTRSSTRSVSGVGSYTSSGGNTNTTSKDSASNQQNIQQEDKRIMSGGKKTKSSSKSSSKKGSSKKTSTTKVIEQKVIENSSPLPEVKSNVEVISTTTTVQQSATSLKSPSEIPSVHRIISKRAVHHLTEENGEEEEEKVDTSHITYTEGSFLNKPPKVETIKEKSEEDLKKEKEKARWSLKQKDLHDMELQVTKHPKFLALQDKLNERLAKRKDKKVEGKVKAPTGYVTYGLVTIKNIASFLELSLSNEEATLNTLEDIHDLLDQEFRSHNIFKVEAELGKFLLASKSVDEMLNLAMKIQVKFNEHKWNEKILELPMFRKLLRCEDLLNDNAVPLFNGPRLSFGIHGGEAATEETEGKKRYCGINIVQVETIGKFVQGGQILISSNVWTKVQSSKLTKHFMNRLGVFKLDDFTTGCSLVEITPEALQERAKFYGAICSHCSKGIQPWEKSFTKLQCTWHVDHFKCFNCGTTVGDGAYASYQGLPHCHVCYCNANPKPKCKKCMNVIAKDYINAMGAYYHANCFSCKQCRKRPTPETPLRCYKDDPYCNTCYEKMVKI